MRYQTYVLHLIDGTAIPMVEDYDLPAEKGIVGHFSKAAPDEIFTVGYSTVYPVVMFLRVLTAQIFILFSL